jgi:Zn finger protein HypA/HybF involved in hydrogenase expression
MPKPPTKKKPLAPAIRTVTEYYKCQFCEEMSPAAEWKKRQDKCPKCGREYDCILAQEGDD